MHVQWRIKFSSRVVGMCDMCRWVVRWDHDEMEMMMRIHWLDETRYRRVKIEFLSSHHLWITFFLFQSNLFPLSHTYLVSFFFNRMHAANFFVLLLFVKMKLIQLVRLGVCLHVDGKHFPTLFSPLQCELPDWWTGKEENSIGETELYCEIPHR